MLFHDFFLKPCNIDILLYNHCQDKKTADECANHLSCSYHLHSSLTEEGGTFHKRIA